MFGLKLVVILSCLSATITAQSDPPSGFIPCEDCGICTEESRETITKWVCLEKRLVQVQEPCGGPGDFDICTVYRKRCVYFEPVVDVVTVCTSWDMKPGCVCNTWRREGLVPL